MRLERPRSEAHGESHEPAAARGSTSALAPRPPLSGAWVMVWLATGLVLVALQQWGSAWMALLSDEPRPPRAPIEVEDVVVDLKLEHKMKLSHLREQAVARGLLVRTDDDWVPARLTAFGETKRVRMRLKGDFTDHLGDDRRWSYRVKVRGGDAIHGMRVFSLQRPKTRFGAWLPLYYDVARSVGILAPRVEIVDVTVGGDPLGPYLWIEHLDKLLLESQQRREGPILRMREDHYWETRNALYRDGHPDRTLFVRDMPRPASPAYAVISTSGEAEEEPERPEKQQLAREAIQRLEGFRVGELPASKVFDVDKLARFLALTQLFDTWHGARWGNLPFALDPLTGLLEPVAFDPFEEQAAVVHLFVTQCAPPCTDPPLHDDFGVLLRLLSDEDFVARHVAALNAFTEDAFIEQIWTRFRDTKPLDGVLQEGPPLDELAVRVRRNRAHIRSALRPPRPLRIYGDAEGLEVANIGWRPLELVDIVGADGCAASFEPLEPVAGVSQQEEPKWRRVPRPGGCRRIDNRAARVGYRFAGDKELRQEPVIERPRLDRSGWPRPTNASAAPAGIDDDRAASGRFRIGAGVEVSITGVVRLPAPLTVEAGAKVRLSGGGQLFVDGPLEVLGVEDAGVLFVGDGTGGVVVHGGGRASDVRFATFERLGAYVGPGVRITGGLTFHDGPVSMERVAVLDGRGEDGLNLVRAPATISGARFAGARSDALDADFSDLTISGSRMSACGNDCLDVSGSSVRATDLVIEGAGDKGISVGERSTVEARNLLVRGAKVGLAVKDGSTLTVAGASLEGCQIGVAAYQKKPEFGPAQAQLAQTLTKDVARLFAVEVGSSVRFNDKDAPAEERGLAAQLDR